MEIIDEGRPKPPPTPCPTIIPIAHALLNPKGSGIIKKKKYGSSDITATASNRDQFSKLTTPDRESGGAQTNQCGLASAAAIIQPAQFVFTTSNNSYNDGDDEDYNAHHNNSTGQASLLAKSYNVEDRSEQYVKRQKMSGTNVSTWAGSKSTSEVSRHLKEKRAEGVAREIPLNHSNTRETSPIDLTKDTEEEEEDLVESSNQIDNIQEEIESYEKKPEKIDSEDPEVCIGQIDVSWSWIHNDALLTRTSPGCNDQC